MYTTCVRVRARLSCVRVSRSRADADADDDDESVPRMGRWGAHPDRSTSTSIDRSIDRLPIVGSHVRTGIIKPTWYEYEYDTYRIDDT